MSKKIRWSVTQQYLESESNLDTAIIKLIDYLVTLEIKNSLLTKNKNLVELINEVQNCHLKHSLEFENCYKITPKTEIILGNIPLMN